MDKVNNYESALVANKLRTVLRLLVNKFRLYFFKCTKVK